MQPQAHPFHLMFVVFALLSGSCVPASEISPPPSPATNPAEEAVVDSYRRMLQSAEAFALDELFETVAENDRGALVVNGRLFLKRADALADARANFRGLKSVKYAVGDCHVTMLAPGVALLVAIGTAAAETQDARSFSSTFAHTVVLVLRDGAWLSLHSHQSNPRPQ